jgi:hypothetical protein
MRAAVVLCAILAAGIARGEFQYKIIARTGQPAPGAPFNFERFGSANFQDDGSLIFITNNDYPHPVLTGIRGLFQQKDATLRLIAFETEQIPGFPQGQIYVDMGTARASQNGTILLGSGIGHSDDVLTSSDSFFIGPDPQSMNQLVHRGDPVPGLADTVFLTAGGRQTNASDQLAVVALIRTSGNDPVYSIFRHYADGTFGFVTKAGDPAPAIPDGVLDSAPIPMVIRDNGDIIIDDTVTTPTGNVHAVYAATASGMHLITRSGIIQPGTEEQYAASNTVFAARNGMIAFDAILQRTTTQILASGVYLGGEGDLKLLARSGWAAPGTDGVWRGDSPEPDFLGSSFELMDLNGSAQAAFLGRIDGPDHDDWGLWAGGRGSLKLIARSGALAPGTTSHFAHFGPAGSGFAPFGRTSLNDLGEIAFWAALEDGFGVFATDAEGTLHLLARTGGQLVLDDGRTVTIDSVDLWMPGIDASGAVAFTATFGNESAVIVASVPEPAIGLAALAAILVLAPRRRRD